MQTRFLLFLCLLFAAPAEISYGETYAKQNLILAERILVEVEISDTYEQQSLGLGFRKKLSEGKGMLFLYSEPGERIFWMKNMQISIDIIWIRKQKIIFVEHRIPPPSLLTIKLPTYGHGVLADQVLEVSAGFTQKNKIKIGDSVRPTP